MRDEASRRPMGIEEKSDAQMRRQGFHPFEEEDSRNEIGGGRRRLVGRPPAS